MGCETAAIRAALPHVDEENIVHISFKNRCIIGFIAYRMGRCRDSRGSALKLAVSPFGCVFKVVQ